MKIEKASRKYFAGLYPLRMVMIGTGDKKKIAAAQKLITLYAHTS